jgi:hypothetical protein
VTSTGRPEFLIAAVYLAAHVFFLAPSLEDIDSINFALGLRDFDVAEHQPHPPGYPLYIAAGRVVLAIANAAWPGLNQVEAEARALSLMSAVAGALAIVFAWWLFDRLARASFDEGQSSRIRLWATILLAVCPLFWMTGVRPMSDMPGLAIALCVQTALLSGRLRIGAFLAGLSLGVRSQTLWLTAPLLALELYRQRGEAANRNRLIAVALAAAGALCWAIPLLVATGGLGGYLAALGSQAGEDFAFVDMLWANPTPRRLAFGLLHTFILPWHSVPLAAVMFVLALAGGGWLLVRARPALGYFAVCFAPYLLFHLVFQETVTVRYALPVIPALAFLAASVLAVTGRAMKFIAAPVAVVSLLVAVPGELAYARDRHPAFRAVADAARRADVDPPAIVTSHFELRRPIRAINPPGLPVLYAPLQREWLGLANYWSSGGTGTAWFLANPLRTDLDLIDRRSRRDVVRYRWTVQNRGELSGTRPAGVDWYRMRPPTWFLGEGWSITPESGGVARAAGIGPDTQPIIAFLRPLTEPAHLIVASRHLGEPSGGPAQFEMILGDRVIDRWTSSFEEGDVLRFVDLPDGVPSNEGYSRLSVRSRPADIATAIRQFDFQPVSREIYGYGRGWHDQEYEASTGSRWRWTSDRALLRIRGPIPAQPLEVRISGESTVKYFGSPATITLSAGGRELARVQPTDNWEVEVTVPPDALAAGQGNLVLATDKTFVPAETEGTGDTRRLGLRVFALDISAAR